MNILAELVKVVSEAAPLLGQVLGGPLGSTVGTLIASELGSKSSAPEDLLALIKNSSDVSFKLKELELSHQRELFRMAIQEQTIEVDDRKDARRYSEKNEWQTFVLGVGYLAFFMATCVLEMMGYAKVNGELQGTLTMIAVMIGAFYFGSSRGERVASQNSHKK